MTEDVALRLRALTGVRRHPRVMLLRTMWRSGPPVCLGLLALTAAGAALALVFVVTLAALVGSVPAALAGGTGSDAADRTFRLVLTSGAVFAAQQVIAAFQPVLAAIVGRRVDAETTERLLVMAGTPVTIGHLEDPAMQARLRAATAVGTAYDSPGLAALSLAAVAVRTFNGFAMLVIIGTYRPWMALLVGLAWFWARREAVEEVRVKAQINRFASAEAQRAMYFRELVLRPEAAKETRVFGLSAWLTSQFRDLWAEMFADLDRKKAQVEHSLFRRFVVIAMACVACLVPIVGAAADGGMSLRRLFLLVQAFLGLVALSTVQFEEGTVITGSASIPALDDIEHDLMATEPPLPRRTAPSLATAVTFDDVTYRYPGQPAPTLEHFDLTIAAGTSLALVGVNGAGKTTTIKLLAELIRPTGGRVLVDGVDLADVDPDTWRRQFGVVFQDFVHYQLSAADNVRFGAAHHPPTVADLERVAERAGLGEVIAGLPSGWDTVLTRQAPGGAEISGGEWQRLALARALWAVEGGARFLVLDEPTAALDVRAEAAFYDRFLDLTRGLTTVVVSHRFSTVRRADRIVVIEGGRVTEDGDHASLLSLGGTYARMYQAQTTIQDPEEEPADA